MVNVIEPARRLLLVLAVAGVLASCSVHDKTSSSASHTTSVSGALTTFNGLSHNGLTTNGLWVNGLWVNGLWVNGLWVNGLWVNGLWVNGLWVNGLWVNGLWVNGLSGNGLWVNGLWANSNWAPELTGAAAIPGNTLRDSPYARQLLQYIYSCAMPARTYDTRLDPNSGTMSCQPTGQDLLCHRRGRRDRRRPVPDAVQMLTGRNMRGPSLRRVRGLGSTTTGRRGGVSRRRVERRISAWANGANATSRVRGGFLRACSRVPTRTAYTLRSRCARPQPPGRRFGRPAATVRGGQGRAGAGSELGRAD